jgi:rhamnogalacturonyl hydrolase YesR
MKKFIIGDNVYFYNKYADEILYGEIIDKRESKYNWDFQLRYLVRPDTDVWYHLWIEAKFISADKSKLEVFIKS